MKWEWPQLVYTALVIFGIGVELERHGQPKTGTHSVWTQIIAAVIAFSLLYYGGFWG